MKMSEVPQALETVAVASLEKRGYSAGEAREASNIIVLAILDHFRAQQIYIPKRWRLHQRDREIYQRANGHNTAELAKEYGLSQGQVTKIIAKGRRAKGRL